MGVVLIGIDDTDNETSPGTGRLARRLAEVLADWGAPSLGITRHQFLKDARIPYTSHNSGACVAVEFGGPLGRLGFVKGLLAEWSAAGSDPGVCIAAADAVGMLVMYWGWAATHQVLSMEEAVATAKAARVELAALGGTGQGIIGALASVGLRADGNEGRFLDLPGLRDLGEQVTQKELGRIGITIEHRGTATISGATYKTFGWVRPRLVGGKAVWPVEWSAQYEQWIPIDCKKIHPVDDG